MNTQAISILLALLNGIAIGNAQGFLNLNFESADIITNGAPEYQAVASDAIPGWTAYVGGNAQTYIVYNTISLGATSISILGANGGPPALDGQYSVELYGGVTDTAASISQTGLIPMSAMAILFIAHYYGPAGQGELAVTLDGQNIPFSAISTEPNYTLYGGNIIGYAGQSKQLEFSALNGENNYWEIDDIQFSPSPIPEPGVLGLSAVGSLMLACRRWRTALK
jgi:hypothetical protein